MFTDLFINLTNLDLQKNAHTEKTEYAYQPKNPRKTLDLQFKNIQIFIGIPWCPEISPVTEFNSSTLLNGS